MNSTIEIRGIKWQARKYAGKLAFSFGSIAIFYNISHERFEAWSFGEMLFSHPSVAECLEVMNPIVLDSFAAQFIPSWEEAEYIEIEPYEIQFEAA